MKNKKSLMIVSTLVKIIIALVVLFLIVIPACNKARKYFFDYGSTESFETFVDGINSMEPGAQQFVLRLDKGSGVIGFGREAANTYDNDFKCYCGSKMNGLTSSERLNVILDKPSNSECNGKACVCLCELETQGETIDGGGGTHGNCKRIISCKGLDGEIDITDKTIITKLSNLPLLGGDWFQYWGKSFLFYRSIAGIPETLNGLGSNLNKEEIITLSVEKRGNLVGVCNSNMLKFNKDRLNINGCINKDASSSCASHRSYRCDSGHVYWFNSCGIREGIEENCGSNGCTGDSCNLPSGCSCSGWSNGNCGSGGCSTTERQQTRNCNPSGCGHTSRCVPDSSCGQPGQTNFVVDSGITSADLVDYYTSGNGKIIYMDNGETFNVQTATINGRDGFYIVKNADGSNFEEFNYDGNTIYHLKDTSWTVICNNGNDAYFTMLDNSYSGDSCSAYSVDRDGGGWIRQNMAVGEVFASDTTIVAFDKTTCSCCSADNTGTTSRSMKLIGVGTLTTPYGNIPNVARLTITAGPGTGESYYIARGYGWIGYEVRAGDPENGNIIQSAYASSIADGNLPLLRTCS